jgi:hypothetical protein
MPAAAVERHIEAPHTGALVAVDTFFVGVLKGVGKVYLQTAIHPYELFLQLEDIEHKRTRVNLKPGASTFDAEMLVEKRAVPALDNAVGCGRYGGFGEDRVN